MRTSPLPEAWSPRYHSQPCLSLLPKLKRVVPEIGPPWRMQTENWESNLRGAQRFRKHPPPIHTHAHTHKVVASGGTAQTGMGALPKGILWSALIQFRGRDVTGRGRIQAWESTQPGCSLGTQLIYYLFICLFPQVHRIELTILLSSWHSISSLVHARSFYS